MAGGTKLSIHLSYITYQDGLGRIHGNIQVIIVKKRGYEILLFSII